MADGRSMAEDSPRNADCTGATGATASGPNYAYKTVAEKLREREMEKQKTLTENQKTLPGMASEGIRVSVRVSVRVKVKVKVEVRGTEMVSEGTTHVVDDKDCMTGRLGKPILNVSNRMYSLYRL